MNISNIEFSKTMPKRWMVFLTLAAVYVPYCWLLGLGESNWFLIKVWPLLPGVAISALIPSLPSRGLDFPLLFTTLLLGISFLTVLKVRKLFWPVLVGLLALSTACSWIICLLMKA